MSVVVKVGVDHRDSHGRYMGAPEAGAPEAGAPEVGGLWDSVKSAGGAIKRAAGRGACYNARYQDLHDLERKLDEPGHTTLTEQDIAIEKNAIARQGGVCRSNRLQAFAPNKIHANMNKMDILAEETRLHSGEKSGSAEGFNIGGEKGVIPPQFKDRIAKERAMGGKHNYSTRSSGECKSCMGAASQSLEISL